MEFINLYYYTSIPIITCNLLFYSITSLSNSITSTQNVFRFIYEHKDSDYLIYRNEIKNIDLLNKIKIIDSLIKSTLKKYIPNQDDYNNFIESINNPIIENNEKEDNYDIIDIKYNYSSDKLIADEPILYSIISVIEIINNINYIITKIKDKIILHKEIYFKSFYTLCLKKEISDLHNNNKLLDIRYNMLVDLLKIYLPLNKKNDI
jgi:hypothetical protein